MARWALPRAAILGLALAAIGCDQVSKRLAASALKDAPGRSYLSDTVRLQYAENRGGFLGLGERLPAGVRFTIFGLGTALVVLGAMFAGLRRESSALEAGALTLIWAGGLSNLIDRAVSGSVVDFLNVGVGGLRSGIFNVADVAITLGCVLLIALRSRAPSAE